MSLLLQWMSDVHLFGIWAKDLANSLTIPFMQIELLMVDDTVIATDDDVYIYLRFVQVIEGLNVGVMTPLLH
jgi:hypothetical protein